MITTDPRINARMDELEARLNRIEKQLNFQLVAMGAVMIVSLVSTVAIIIILLLRM